MKEKYIDFETVKQVGIEREKNWLPQEILPQCRHLN